MRVTHTVAQVRAAEDALRATLPPGTLMQRAATGLAVETARFLAGRVYGARVHLLVGGGDNGADALWAGALLGGRGAQVTATVVGTQRDEAALAAFARVGGRLVPHPPRDPDAVLDGLVGIGGTGPLRDQAAELVRDLDPSRTIAVDVPSGVDADTGVVAGEAVRSVLTVTFGTLKPGLLVGAGRDHAGEVQLVDIGLGPWLPEPTVRVVEGSDVPGLPEGSAHDKYTRGVVGVVAGSPSYTGAAVLAVGGAVRAGAGMVRFAGATHSAEQVRTRWPEAVVTEAEGTAVVDAGRVQAWVVGPGLGTGATAAEAVEAVLASGVPVLVDADALTVLAQHPQWVRDRSAPTVLTPHDREAARFGREVGPDRLAAARALAEDLGCTVLLKGAATVVTGPGGTWVNATGTTHLATAGTGDVLAGGIGTLLARGLELGLAAAVGAHLHGLAGQLSGGAGTTSASRVLEAWPDAVALARTGRIRE
ncbi:MAG: NAD(P)H-hydrate dehydratase [Mycobacteriales bacterium]|nr:NAD(P)H-hydrate dehydratase [Mycobacteriales bacterium]